MSNSTKPSGVEWIGSIPENWLVERYKNLSSTLYGFPLSSDLFSNDNNFMPIIRIRNITSGTVETYYSGDCPDKYIIHKGDILVGMDGDFNVRRWGGPDSYLNQRCCRVNGGESVLPDFLLYALPGALNDLNAGTTSATVKHLLAPDIENLRIALPPVSEQYAIVSFLDETCNQIDSIVDNKKKQLEQLTNYKKSLISECVCRGVPGSTSQDIVLKDSGYEWLGEIPTNWHLSRMSNICSFGGSLSILKTDLGEEGCPCVSYGEIHGRLNFAFDADKDFIRKAPESFVKNNNDAIVKPGDFLFADTSEDLEGSGNFSLNRGSKPVYAGYHVVHVKNTSKNDSVYLAYMFESDQFRRQIQGKVSGVKVYSITKPMISKARIWLPPLYEQHKIVEFLDEKCEYINNSIKILLEEISELSQYKKSLIWEYVTGKKRVV